MKKIIIAATAAVLAATVSCGTGKKSRSSHKPYEPAINSYCRAMTDCDPDALLECTLPKEAAAAAKNSPDHDDFYKSGKEGMEAVRQGWIVSCGAGPEMTLDEIKSSVQLSDAQLRSAESYLSSASEQYGANDLSPKVSEGYETVLSLKISGADYVTTMENTCCMVNIEEDGWKMITVPADALEGNAGE